MKRRRLTFWLTLMLVLGLALAVRAQLPPTTSGGSGQALLNLDNTVALHGYDPVAYFTGNEAVRGNKRILERLGAPPTISPPGATVTNFSGTPRTISRNSADTARPPWPWSAWKTLTPTSLSFMKGSSTCSITPRSRPCSCGTPAGISTRPGSITLKLPRTSAALIKRPGGP
jgi:hypothetical protein